MNRSQAAPVTVALQGRSPDVEAGEQADDATVPETHGDMMSSISDGIVAVFKEHYGRGPSQAKSYVHDDIVVCVLRGGYSRVEQTLLNAGRAGAVLQQRREFHELMRGRFIGVAREATGREVIGCMSGSQQEPDLTSVLFVLAQGVAG